MGVAFRTHAGFTQKVGQICENNPKFQRVTANAQSTGQSNQKSLYIMCDDSKHCQDFQFSDIVLVGAVSIEGLLNLQYPNFISRIYRSGSVC